jgi:iron(III) transport system ATP-binding protein
MSGAVAQLQLQDIERRIAGLDILKHVSFSVATGEIVSLLGPAGSDKSTVLRIAAGLERPDAGHVMIGGQPVVGRGRFTACERRSIALVTANHGPNGRRSIFANVAAGLRGMKASERKARAMAALDRVGLAHSANKLPRVLSSGARLRAALACALVGEPQLLLMDEPFSGVSREEEAPLRERVTGILRAAKIASLIATTDPSQAFETADRIVLMHDGRVVQDAEPESLWRLPRSSWAAGYLSEINRLPGIVQAGRVMTPWGLVFRPGLRDGPVQIMVRPCEVRPEPYGASGPDLVVEATKYLGGAYLVAGTLVSAEFGRAPFRARLALADSPSRGARIRLRCEANAILIFSAEA